MSYLVISLIPSRSTVTPQRTLDALAKGRTTMRRSKRFQRRPFRGMYKVRRVQGVKVPIKVRAIKSENRQLNFTQNYRNIHSHRNKLHDVVFFLEHKEDTDHIFFRSLSCPIPGPFLTMTKTCRPWLSSCKQGPCNQDNAPRLLTFNSSFSRLSPSCCHPTPFG